MHGTDTGSRVVSWIIDVISRLGVESTYIEGGFLAPSHVDRACREAGVQKNRTALLELLTKKGVLLRRKNDTVYYLDTTAARTLVHGLLRDQSVPDVSHAARVLALTYQRLSQEATRRREAMKSPILSTLLTDDLAIAFNTLRGLAKLCDGEYRLCLPADIGEIDDAWLDHAFVPVTRRTDFVAGMERLLAEPTLFRRVGRHERGVIYRFCVDPHRVNVQLSDTVPIPRPVKARSSRPPSCGIRAAI